MQACHYGSFDGPVHVFISRESLVRGVTLRAPSEDGELPVVHITRVLQAANGANPPEIAAIQIETKAPEACGIIARRIVTALVELRGDLVHLGFHFSGETSPHLIDEAILLTN
jgi:hypothetical protein